MYWKVKNKVSMETISCGYVKNMINEQFPDNMNQIVKTLNNRILFQICLLQINLTYEMLSTWMQTKRKIYNCRDKYISIRKDG